MEFVLNSSVYIRFAHSQHWQEPPALPGPLLPPHLLGFQVRKGSPSGHTFQKGAKSRVIPKMAHFPATYANPTPLVLSMGSKALRQPTALLSTLEDPRDFPGVRGSTSRERNLFHMSSNWSSPATLQKHYCFLHFTDEDTKVQRGEDIQPKSPSKSMHRWILNTGLSW